MKKAFFFNSMKFLMLIFVSMLMCLTSSNLMFMWMSLEMNFYAFLPMLLMNSIFEYEKSLMMYFWIQSIASSTFLFIILMMKMITISKVLTNLLMLMMMMKMGLFPFHLWILSMAEKLSWFLTAFILSIQKFLPIMITSMIIFKCNLNMLIIMNTMFSSMAGMKTFSMRKIFIFSSLNHLSIMLFSMMHTKKITLLYLMIYTLMNFSLSKMFSILNINFFNQLFMCFEKISKSFSIIVVTMSMMGLPPFLGFIPKTMVFIFLLEQKEMFYVALFLIFNTLSTFFYLRLILSNLILNLNKEKKKIISEFNLNSNTILILPYLSNYLFI